MILSIKDADNYKLGFGKVYVEDSFPKDQQDHLAAYKTALKREGREGLTRLGQPITDFKRPGMLSEDAMSIIPEPFKKASLMRDLQDMGFPHGSGINRWRLLGTYPRESWEHDLPAAGAHSASVADSFLGLNCLSPKSLFGDVHTAQSIGLLLSAFMNFGGYHSFVETFPIAQAIAHNTSFEVKVTKEHSQHLYPNMVDAVKQYASKNAAKEVSVLHDAFQASKQRFIGLKSKES